MIDAATTEAQLAAEVAQLRQRLAAYEKAEESRFQDCPQPQGESPGSAALHRIILENISDAVFVTDYIGKFTYVCPNADNIFGYSAAEIQAMGNIAELLGNSLVNFAELELLGEISNIEHEILAKNGSTHSLLINVKRISIQGGTVLYTCRDITDRKVMEQALRDSEKQYRLLFHHNPQPILTYDLQTLAVLEVNQAALNLYGYSRDEFLQLTVKKLVPPEDVPDLLEMIKNIQPGVARHYGHRQQTKDGRLIFVEVSSHGLMFNGKRSRLVMAHDITASKQVEEALRQEKYFAETIINSLPGMFCMFDEQGNPIRWNKKVEEVTGYSPTELATQNLVNFCEGTDKDLARRKMQIALAEGYADAELTLVTKEGEKVPYLLTGARMTLNGLNYIIGFGIDITERRQAEEALRTSDAFLNSIIDQSPYPLWVADDQGTLIRINRACLDQMHVEEEDVVGKYNMFQDNIVAQQGYLPQLRRVFEQGETAHFEFRYDTSQLQHLQLRRTVVLILDATVFPIKDSSGRITNAVVQQVDISERKQAEEALRENERKYRSLYEEFQAIVNAIPDVLCLLSPDLRIVWSNNPSSGPLYKRGIKEIIGQHCYPVRHFRSEPCENCPVLKCFSSGKLETAQVTAFGGVWELCAVPLYDEQGKLRGAVELARDITERHRAEKALRLNSARLEALLALGRLGEAPVASIAGYAIEQGVSLTGSRVGLLLLFNETGSPDLYVYPPAEDAAYRTNFIDLKTLWEEAIQNKQVVNCPKNVPPLPSPTYGALENYISVPIFEGESLIAVALVGNKDEEEDYQETDVQQLQLLMEGMWTIIRNQKLRDQLQQNEKLASLGLLVSGVAHEINNPNSFITFNLPILRDYIELIMPLIDDHAARHHDFTILSMPYREWRIDLFKLLENLEHGSNRINLTVSGLREFAREGKKKEKDRRDPGLVIERAINLCKSQLQKMVRSVEVRIAPDLPQILCIPQSLEQILVNLLINAAQAADKAESFIKIKAMLVQGRPPHLLIEVSDNGCGMSPEMMKKIFDPFFTTKPTGEGTGLGLSICHRLVEEMGGRIEVNSKPGRGSTFRILLPVAPPPSD